MRVYGSRCVVRVCDWKVCCESVWLEVCCEGVWFEVCCESVWLEGVL